MQSRRAKTTYSILMAIPLICFFAGCAKVTETKVENAKKIAKITEDSSQPDHDLALQCLQDAYDITQELDPSRQKILMMIEIADTAAGHDSEIFQKAISEALEATRKIEDPEARDHELWRIAEVLGMEDPKAAFRLTEEIESPKYKVVGLAVAARAAQDKDDTARAKEIALQALPTTIELMEKADKRTRFFYRIMVFGRISEIIPDEIIEAANREILDAENVDFALAFAAGEIAKSDYEKAVKIATGLSGEAHDRAFRMISESLKSQDATKSLDATRQINDSASQAMSLVFLAETIGETDPQFARALCQEAFETGGQLRDDSIRKAAIQQTATMMIAEIDADEGYGLAKSIKDTDSHCVALKYVVREMAKKKPRRARAIVDEMLKDAAKVKDSPGTRDECYIEAYEAMLYVSPEAADQILQKIDKKSLSHFPSILLGDVAKIDIDAALRLLEYLSDEEDNESYLAYVVRGAARNEPARAVELAKQIEQPDERAEKLCTIAYMIFRKEQEAARQ